MRSFLFILCLSASSLSFSQEVLSDRIKGLRIFGPVQAGFPVVIQDSTSITIEFDLNEDHPADIRLRYYHCDRDWNRTRTSFINDDMRNKTRFPLPYEAAPSGIEYYRFHYTVQLPGIPEVQRFLYSGNYILELWDDREEQLLARAKFFVVEKTIKPTIRVPNRQLSSVENPFNKRHRAEVQFTIPEVVTRREEISTSGALLGQSLQKEESLSPILLTTVDMYKNREAYSPKRIDANSPGSNTFVYGLGTRRVRFVIDDLVPGNEYRRLDLRNVTDYPPNKLLRLRQGSDVSRMLFRAARDNNGFSSLVTGNRYADYVQVQFEYRDDSRNSGDSIFIVGDFNGWNPTASAVMRYDESTKRFVWLTWLRRGEYDYQYTLGNDWVALEGNDWRTVNVYTALVYYKDERFGGFDRIVGFVQGRSSGQNEATDL